jgi:hypothetical protein
VTIVQNIRNPDSKVVFVLESPHVDEVRCGFPLAGVAGRHMSRRLLNCPCVPFGIVALLPDLARHFDVEPFSVVNVSQKPLQRRAYEQNGISLPTGPQPWEEVRRKVANAARFNVALSPAAQRERDSIYVGFSSQLEPYLTTGCTLVACGRFAQAFCMRVVSARRSRATVILLPHPSHQRWDSVSQAEVARIRRALGLRGSINGCRS